MFCFVHFDLSIYLFILDYVQECAFILKRFDKRFFLFFFFFLIGKRAIY